MGVYLYTANDKADAVLEEFITGDVPAGE
jgi:hypothetical protein